ncbi:MAG: DUF5666 domain-containing protein [Chloroflexi bacterium]|nr:DUF5666 domain-containing protein [Chloroflexota bacterium]MCL5735660.1 DUF5666 domain-containing protein [Actinomycetota bacterium]
MKKWLIAVVVVLVIAVGVGAFFGGRASAGSSTQTPNTNGQATTESGQFPGNGTPPSGDLAVTGANGVPGRNMVAGSIIAADDSSITVKTSDGNSKIILVSGSTSISKTQDAAQSDLVIGEDVVVSGTSNDDGSITATRIELGGSLPQVTPPSGGSTTTTAVK